MEINSKNKIYLLTIEYNSETEEIEYIAEELIDNRKLEEVDHVGDMDMEATGWDIEDFEFMRDHYSSGKS